MKFGLGIIVAAVAVVVGYLAWQGAGSTDTTEVTLTQPELVVESPAEAPAADEATTADALVEEAADSIAQEVTEAAETVAQTLENATDGAVESAAATVEGMAEGVTDKVAAIASTASDGAAALFTMEGFDFDKASDFIAQSELNALAQVALTKALDTARNNPEMLSVALEKARVQLGL